MSDTCWSALILAGGRGQRMQTEVPKPLVVVAGRSLVEHNVMRAWQAGAREVFVAIHHRADEVATQLECNLGGVVDLRFVHEPMPLGTIGALGLLPSLGAALTVMSANGDLLSAIDLRALVAAHHAANDDATVTTHVERHQLALGEVNSDEDGRICAYHEKPIKEYRISSGTNVFGPRMIELLDGRTSIGVPDLIQRALARGLILREYHHDHAWIDVNDVADIGTADQLHLQRRGEYEQSSPSPPTDTEDD